MRESLSTAAFAKAVGVSPNTIRHELCQRGHYLGVRPQKLSNRLLAWPGDQINALLIEKSTAGVGAGVAK